MITRQALDAALAAHVKWKTRLREAIATGQSEFRVDMVKRDTLCEFGQWLEHLPPEDKATAEYRVVKTLHTAFHRTAAEVLELALMGRKDTALKKLAVGERYGNDSGAFVLALNAWKSKL